MGAVDVSADGSFVYTPGPGFSGSDKFTVKVTPEERAFNLLDPFGDGSREVTVQVGTRGYGSPFLADRPVLAFDPNAPATAFDPIDTAVYYPNASARIKLRKSILGQVTGTVTLTGVTNDIDIQWMDAKGRTGTVSVADLATQYWTDLTADARASGGGITVAVDFQSPNGTGMTVLLNNVAASAGTQAGQYTFTGKLSPNPADSDQRVDQWDVLGASFHDRYDNFLKAYTASPGFTSVDLTVAKADFFAMTYTPASYRADIAGTDPGVKFSNVATETPVGALPVSADLSGIGAYYNASVSRGGIRMMPYSGPAGPTLITGDPLGRIKFGGLTPGWTTVQGTGWKSAVNTLMPYGDGFVVGLADGAIEQWTAGGFRELIGTGWASAITTMIPNPSGGLVVGLEDGAVQKWDGASWSEIQGPRSGTYLRNVGDGLERFTQYYPVTQLVPYGDGFIIGMGKGYRPEAGQDAGGQVFRWTGTKMVQLQDDSKWGPDAPIVSAMPYQTGFIVGLGNGSIQQWTPAGGDSGKWTELQGSGWKRSANTLTPYGNGFVVGLGGDSDGGGNIEQWTATPNGSGYWRELQNSGWKSPATVVMPYKSSFVVGLANGSIAEWIPDRGFAERHGTGWNAAVTSLVPLNDGFVVGLSSGAIEKWTENPDGKGGVWSELQSSRISLTEQTLKDAVA